MKQLVWINLADYLAVTEQVVSSNAEKIVQFAKLHNRKVIAYNIEIPLNFEVCKTLIIDFYCGDFVFRPTATADHKIPANKLHLMHLIKHVQAKEIDLIEVAKIIKNDALLSFQLLKIANSAAFLGGVELNSIDQSILRLGTNQLKHWAMTLSMRQISDKPIEVLESGLIRAYMAQTIATQFSEVNPQTAYTAGLLSILDCVLNKSMEEIAREIGLSPEMTKALSQFEGPTGQLLSTVIAYETGNWQNMPQQDIDALDLSRIYIESLSHIQNEYQWLH
jgi:EAL and modified HD-GYP domain-containing signal transduction protein